MLVMSNVCYKYSRKSNSSLILNNVSVKFIPGNFYSIQGLSGSGKTTCLSLLGGLEKPTSGDILLSDMNISEIWYNKFRRKYIAYIFQDFHLFNYMTAMENVMVAMNVTKSVLNKQEARNKAASILQSLGLNTNDIHRVVTKLSGGQQQRVAIARAIATNATYILADEPTGNLDKMNSSLIIEILRSLVDDHNKCVIAVTHSDQFIDASDYCYKIAYGELSLVESKYSKNRNMKEGNS